jgi:hypothetical protein
VVVLSFRSCDDFGGDMVTAKKASAIPAAKLELYEKLIATCPEIERKGDVHLILR